MKRLFSFALCLTLIIGLIPSGIFSSTAAALSSDMRGVWIASVHNIDFPSNPGLSKEKQQEELDKIIGNAKSMGLNSVFFQVRPSADALYHSDYFPWSAFLTGEQGKVNDGGFDPLAYIIEKGHAEGIAIHAWLNPLRVTTGTAAKPQIDVNALAKNNPARQNPSHVVSHGGALYFDPGHPEVRDLIVKGALEIVDRYDVDGIHFDDYFYPTKADGKDFSDSASYQKYGAAYASLADFRRGNIDKLIADVAAAVHERKPDVSFGISPFAVWADKSRHSDGSDTSSGLSTYLDHYADTRKWVKEETIDYIAPQIYWSTDYDKANYAKLLQWWSDVTLGTSVKLYVGHAAYKVGDGAQSATWLDPEEITRQMQLALDDNVASGSIFYGYQNILKNTLSVKDKITEFYNDTPPPRDGMIMPAAPSDKGIILSSPKNGFSTTGKNVSILGSSDPNHPIYMNGTQISVTADGHFAVYPALALGDNVFTFTHKGETKALTVKRTGSSSSGSSGGGSGSSGSGYFMGRPEFKPGSLYPAVSTTRAEGTQLIFGCTAPAGATSVTVQIGAYKLNLARDSATAATPKLVPAKYTGVFTFPQTSSEKQEIGTPVFSFSYDGVTYTQKLNNTISVMSKASAKVATVSATEAVSRSGPSTSYDVFSTLTYGVTDYIYGEHNGYYYLRSGIFVPKESVNVSSGKLSNNSVTKFELGGGTNTTDLLFYMPVNAPYKLERSGDTIKLTFYNTKGQSVTLPKDVYFESLTYNEISSDVCQYIIKLKSVNQYYGHTAGYLNGAFILSLKNPPILAGEKPLSGLTVLLDAGHGADPGAMGPMGSFGPNEKDINLAITLYAQRELERLGAKVILTRTTDVRVSLTTRQNLIKSTRPDISVSIHANSLAETSNYGTTNGLMVFYTKDFSKPVAEYIKNFLVADLGRVDKGARQQQLAVCNVTNTPAILIETGFMSNPEEFEWLSKPENQEKIGTSIARSLEAWAKAQQ